MAQPSPALQLSRGLLVSSQKEMDRYVEESRTVATLAPPVLSKAVMFYGFEKLLRPVGNGSYGFVYKAIDPCTKWELAVKVFPPDHAEDYTHEARMHYKCNFHPSVVTAYNTFASDDGRVGLIMDFMGATLADVTNLQLSERLLRCIMQQVFSGLAYIHSMGIVHCDIKCNNILLDRDGNVRLADFGLAEHASNTGIKQRRTDPDMLVTPYYRPPDMHMGACQIEPAIDMWSVGCVLAELVLGHTLFRPHGGSANATSTTILQRIIRCLGRPPSDAWGAQYKDRNRLDAALRLTAAYPPSANAIGLPTFNKNRQRGNLVSDELIDLINKLLRYEPSARLSAADALTHSWMRGSHASKDELAATCVQGNRVSRLARAPSEDAKLLQGIKHSLEMISTSHHAAFQEAYDNVAVNAAIKAPPSVPGGASSMMTAASTMPLALDVAAALAARDKRKYKMQERIFFETVSRFLERNDDYERRTLADAVSAAAQERFDANRTRERKRCRDDEESDHARKKFPSREGVAARGGTGR